MSKSVTSAQKSVLEYISDFALKNGYSPTYAEIGEHFGISKIAAREHVLALEKKGKVKIEDNKARSIKILDSAYTTRAEIVTLPYYKALPSREFFETQSPGASYKVSTLMVDKKKRYFALRMDNDTMAGAGIKAGDVLIFERANEARDNEIVFACPETWIDEAPVIRTFKKYSTKFELQPECDNVGTIVCQSLQVYGILRLSLRNYER